LSASAQYQRSGLKMQKLFAEKIGAASAFGVRVEKLFRVDLG
jgi:hypothetical protein